MLISTRRFHLTMCMVLVWFISLGSAFVWASPPPPGKKHHCGFAGHRHDTRRYARTLEHLNVGEPRTVRMIYFLPTDWEFDAEVVEKMKSNIRTVQTFFAERMLVHGHGYSSFDFETDGQGEPVVHRVDGKHPFSDYANTLGDAVIHELEQAFDFHANVYLVVLGTDSFGTGEDAGIAGVGVRLSKNGGGAMVLNEFDWILIAHELGHAFGLGHDFRDGKYIMSYGPGESVLSSCNAGYLSVHPYFNPEVPTEDGEPGVSEVISPRIYESNAQSVPITLEFSHPEGELYQALLFGVDGLIECQWLVSGKESLAVYDFDYDGVETVTGFVSLADMPVHPIYVEVVDTAGNIGFSEFRLAQRSPHLITSFSGHTSPVVSLAFSPDGTLLASASAEDSDTEQPGGTVRLWEVETETTVTAIDDAGTAAFSRDGTTYATGSTNGAIDLWDAATHRSITTLPGHEDAVRSIAFSHDDSLLASTALNDFGIKLWDIATAEHIADLEGHADYINSIAFSPIEKTLASGSWDSTVKLWDIETRQTVTTFEEHLGWVWSVAYSPDGKTLASGSLDRTVKLWDVTARKNTGTLTGHTDFVLSVAFSPDGETLASGSADGTVKLWDVGTGVAFATLPHTDAVESVAFMPGGTRLASGTAGGSIVMSDTTELMRLRIDAIVEVDMPDPALRDAVREIMTIPPDTPIRRGHLTPLTALYAFEVGISDLTGLEGATNLTSLDLSSNEITDLSPLASLTKLRSLHLWGNAISDISPVSGLTNLASLDLAINSISDISSLTGLTNLEWLDVSHNEIEDLAPLAANTGLGAGDEVDVAGNRLNDVSINTHIPALQERGVAVNHESEFTPPTYEIEPFAADVDGDGVVNILDLVMVASSIDEEGDNVQEDVNRDGVVDILDLVFVAAWFGAEFEDVPAASPAVDVQVADTVTAARVKGWISDAKSLPRHDATMRRGIAALEQLLASLIPARTALLPNYPNPFNPETWIPYQLVSPAKAQAHDLRHGRRIGSHIRFGTSRRRSISQSQPCRALGRQERLRRSCGKRCLFLHPHRRRLLCLA
ncbi:MAG: leucine-rich repeat domain-containing protein [Candidatus Poribacteria bacterium]|nr:leucine-rich repeat domain-containing protein [Candidatus Poribacteria bacterium]